MDHKIRFSALIVTALATAALMSCNGKAADVQPKVSDTPVATSTDTADTAEIGIAPFDGDEAATTFIDGMMPMENIPANITEEKTPAKKKQSTAAPSRGGRETLYISTYGANGRVWGHVTMNGNTGRGTIHDDGENSYSITVSRHGGELFGTDQNGRQYVFKL